MGYRSDIGLCLDTKGKELLELNLEKITGEERQSVANFIENPDSKQEKDDSLLLVWNSIKWYSEFNGVKLIENLIEELGDDNYLFIRIGEDNEDIYVQGSYWDNPFSMDLERRIMYETN